MGQPVAGRNWLSARLQELTAPAEVRGEPRPLIPRQLPDGGWALPMLVVVRLPRGARPGPSCAPLPVALASMAEELGDPSLVGEGIRAFAESLHGDEFTARVAGETVRAGHAARSMPDTVPWLIASLPDEFSLTELHRAVMACMGGADAASGSGSPADSPGAAAESPSNFRRRVNDLVLSGVLEELPSSSRLADSDRPGRPPRMFRFSKSAWSAWLLRRSGAAAHAVDAGRPAMSAQLRSVSSSPLSQQLMKAFMVRESATRPPGSGGSPDRPAADDSRLFIELKDLLKKYSQGQ